MKIPDSCQRPKRNPDQRGIALVIVLLILMALTFAGVSLMGSSRVQTTSVASDIAQSQCLFLADAGVNEGRVTLLRALNASFRAGELYPSSTQSLLDSTVNMGAYSGAYSVRATGTSGAPSIFDEAITITSTCRGVAGSVVRISMNGNPAPGSFFTRGACGCESLDASVTTDSYASALGGYGSSNADGNQGNVGSDGVVNISGTINGTVTAGGDADTSGSTISGAVYYGGTLIGPGGAGGNNHESPPPTPCRCSQVVSELTRPSLTATGLVPNVTGLATLVANARTDNDNEDFAAPFDGCNYTGATTFDLTCHGGGQAFLSPYKHAYADPLSGETMYFGLYYLKSLDFSGGGGSGTGIVIDWDGTHNSIPKPAGSPPINPAKQNYMVYLYLEGGALFKFRGGSVAASPTAEAGANAWALEIWHVGPGGTFSFGGNSQFGASLFSADADVDLQGTPDFYGALTGRTFGAGGSAAFHYDETMGREKRDFVSSFARASWHVLRD